MDFKERVLKLYHLELHYIWTHTLDEGPDNELILDPNCFYFEFENNNFLKIFDIQGERKIGVTIEENMNHSSEMNEEMDTVFKIDLRHFLLEYTETGYYVEKIGGIKIETVNANAITCEAIEIDLFTEHYGKQGIFIYSGIFGLSIGGMDKKNAWIERLYIPLYGNNIDERFYEISHHEETDSC